MFDGDAARAGGPLPSPDVAADLAILEVIEQELGDVDVALRRLDDGTYGTCERCGTVIEAAILTSAPLTRSCARCGTSAATLFGGPAGP